MTRPAVPTGIAATSALCALALVAGAAPSSAKPYTTKRAPYGANVRFVVTYTGSGRWRTVYHSEPPNQGGDHDTNDADDSSTQAWRLKFKKRVALPACGPAAGGGSDPCTSLEGLDGATGPTHASGRIDHTHVDGLYRSLDMAEKCRVSKGTGAKRSVVASIGLSYSAGSKTVAVTAYEPVSTVLTDLPQACPGHGDSLDGLLDNYFTPGFSFDSRYGSARWFTSRTIVIPAGVFHHAAEIRIPLADTKAGRPPRHCAVEHPSYERCKTGGSWAGVLTFTLRL